MTLLEPRTVAIYLVEAHKHGGTKERAKRIATMSVEASPIDLALHASHNYIYVMSDNGRVQVKHLRASKDSSRGGLVAIPTLEADQGYRGTCLALDPSGLYLVTVCTAPDLSASTLCLWEAGTGDMVDCVRHLPAVCSVSFTGDNQGIVAGCHDGALVLLHLPLELTRDAAYVLLGGPSSSFLQILGAAHAVAGDAAPRDPPPASGSLLTASTFLLLLSLSPQQRKVIMAQDMCN